MNIIDKDKIEQIIKLKEKLRKPIQLENQFRLLGTSLNDTMLNTYNLGVANAIFTLRNLFLDKEYYINIRDAQDEITKNYILMFEQEEKLKLEEMDKLKESLNLNSTGY